MLLLGVSGAEALLTEEGPEWAAGTMEPPSAPPRGGRVPWQELLLAGERDNPLGVVGGWETEAGWGLPGGQGSERGQGSRAGLGELAQRQDYLMIWKW